MNTETNNSFFSQCLDAVLFAQEEEKTGHGEEDEQSGPPPRAQDSAGPSQCVEGQESFLFLFQIMNCCSHPKQIMMVEIWLLLHSYADKYYLCIL